MAERDLALITSQVEMNSGFRVGWPLGEFGSLPADAEQDRELLAIRDRMAMMWEEIEENDEWIDEFNMQVEIAYLTMRVESLEKIVESRHSSVE